MAETLTVRSPGPSPSRLDGGLRVYFSTGSTGQPKRMVFTAHDWRETVLHRAECLSALGIQPSDTVAAMVSFGPWFSGDNIIEALAHLGARVIPTGIHAAHLPGIHRLAEKLGATVIVTTPSIALALSEHGSIPSLKRLVLIGEHACHSLRVELHKRLGGETVGLFAATEAILGYEDEHSPGVFCWDPDRLYLEVLRTDGSVAPFGRGELLVTKRYGAAAPVVRYRLGDLAEIVPRGGDAMPGFRFLGRAGHAFSLATGVKISRAQLERFLDSLVLPIARAEFDVLHGCDGRDRVTITMHLTHCRDRELSVGPAQVAEKFEEATFEVEDVASCGYLSTEVRYVHTEDIATKREVVVVERPWKL